MKTPKYFLFVVAIAMMVAGCHKPVEVSFTTDSRLFEAQGGTAEIDLKSNGDWTIESSAEWISVSPTSGSGDATLTLTALPNTTMQSRTAEVKATTADNMAVLTVTQSFPDHYINIDPVAYECFEEGGEFNVQISSNIDWTVSSLPAWIHCSEMSGSGDGQLSITVEAFAEGALVDREVAVTLGDEETTAVLHVAQRHTPANVITVTPDELQMAYGGETKSFVITYNGSWTAIVGQDWVTLDQTEGEGDTEVAVTVGENPLYEPRSCDVKLISDSGSTTSVMVNQEAAPNPHYLEVTPTNLNFGKDGGTQEITINCDEDWNVVIQSNWVSLSALSGNGNGMISVTVSPNPIAESRIMEFSIVSSSFSQNLRVTQEAGDEPIVVSFEPDTLYATYLGGALQTQLNTNTTWTLEPTVNWIIVSSGTSGEGDSPVYLIIDYNGDETPRTGYLNVIHSDQLIGRAVIVQEGKPNILEADITELEARPEGGEYTIQVTANQNWAASTDVAWITCAPAIGSGNGTLTLTIAPIPAIQVRVGHVKLKGLLGQEVTITVTQHQ